MNNKFRNRIFGTLLTLVLLLGLIAPTQAMASIKIIQKNGKDLPSVLYTNRTYKLKAVGVDVDFYSSDDSIAVITKGGKLTAKGCGTVTITANKKDTSDIVASATINVNERASSIRTDIAAAYMEIGDTRIIHATVTPSTSTDVIRFFSSDKSIVTVDSITGKITAINNGNATIKAVAKATETTSNRSKYNLVATTKVVVRIPADAKVNQVKQLDTDKLQFFCAEEPTGTLISEDFVIFDLTTFQVFSVTSNEVVKATDGKGYYIIIKLNDPLVKGSEYEVNLLNNHFRFTATL